jgi:hypothetical protein
MTESVKKGNDAYDSCKEVIDEASRVIGAPLNEICQLSESTFDQRYIGVLRKLMEFLSKDDGILRLFEDVKEAREGL